MFKKPNAVPTLNATSFDNGLMLTEQIEYEHEVVDEFTCNNRKCIIIRMQLPLRNYIYHNGYIECNEGFDGDIIGGEEITFRGDLAHIPIDDENCYIGFHTCHLYNTIHPETQTAEYVKSKCQEIAYQLRR